MADWISVEEGTYRADAACLLTAGNTGMTLDDAIVEVYLDGARERRLRGSGFAVNVLLVELLEDYDEIDLLLDLGGQFKYLLKAPTLSAGKVFSSDVKSLMHFIAKSPLQKLSSDEYSAIRERLALIDRPRT